MLEIVLLITVGFANLVMMYYKESYYRATMDRSDGNGSTDENVLLVHAKDGKLKASSVTCSKEGHVACKKLKVGELDMSIENPTENGVVFVDDEKLRVSDKVSCRADGTVACGKLIVGDVTLDFTKETRGGTLTYDKGRKRVTIQRDSNVKVTTDNNQQSDNHIALFAAGSSSSIMPSRIKLDVRHGQNSATGNFLTLENDVLKLAPLEGKYFRFADDVPNPETLSGLVVSYGPKLNELTYSNDLGFDVDSMKAADPGDILAIGGNKRITASKENRFFVRIQDDVSWQPNRLVLTTSTTGICTLSPVSVGQNFLAPMNNEEFLVVNRNNVLELTPFNLVKATNPENLTQLQRRIAMFHPTVPNTIVPSRFAFDFDADDASNVGKMLTLTAENVFGLTNPSDLNVVQIGSSDKRADPPALALFDTTNSRVESSQLRLNFDTPSGDSQRSYFWTVQNNEVKLRPIQPQLTITNPSEIIADRNYLPVIACASKNGSDDQQLFVKTSQLYMDDDGSLVVPNGCMIVNGVAISLKSENYEDGMYLVYDGTEKAFVPKKPALCNVRFKTPISEVRKTSHLVLKEGEWDFVECSEQVRAARQIVGTTPLALTVAPEPVPGMKYSITNEKTCIIFAECVAAWSGDGGSSMTAQPPTVCFYLQLGESSVSRKYYVNVQGKAFHLTNYVSIFETVDTSSLGGQDITMMAHVLSDIPSARGTLKMTVNADKLSEYVNCSIPSEDDSTALKCRMCVRFVQ